MTQHDFPQQSTKDMKIVLLKEHRLVVGVSGAHTREGEDSSLVLVSSAGIKEQNCSKYLSRATREADHMVFWMRKTVKRVQTCFCRL